MRSPSLATLNALAKQVNPAWKVERAFSFDGVRVITGEPRGRLFGDTGFITRFGTYNESKRDCAEWLRKEAAR